MTERVYVKVCAKCDEAGRITPVAFTREGQTLPITRVVECREAKETRAGGRGFRYLVRVGDHQTCLYMDEERRWYVEEEQNVREIPYFD